MDKLEDGGKISQIGNSICQSRTAMHMHGQFVLPHAGGCETHPPLCRVSESQRVWLVCNDAGVAVDWTG